MKTFNLISKKPSAILYSPTITEADYLFHKWNQKIIRTRTGITDFEMHRGSYVGKLCLSLDNADNFSVEDKKVLLLLQEVIWLYEYWIKQFYLDCTDSFIKHKIKLFKKLLGFRADAIFNRVSEELKQSDIEDTCYWDKEPQELDFDLWAAK